MRITPLTPFGSSLVENLIADTGRVSTSLDTNGMLGNPHQKLIVREGQMQ